MEWLKVLDLTLSGHSVNQLALSGELCRISRIGVTHASSKSAAPTLSLSGAHSMEDALGIYTARRLLLCACCLLASFLAALQIRLQRRPSC